jgi:hypothetical protein
LASLQPLDTETSSDMRFWCVQANGTSETTMTPVAYTGNWTYEKNTITFAVGLADPYDSLPLPILKQRFTAQRPLFEGPAPGYGTYHGHEQADKTEWVSVQLVSNTAIGVDRTPDNTPQLGWPWERRHSGICTCIT